MSLHTNNTATSQSSSFEQSLSNTEETIMSVLHTVLLHLKETGNEKLSALYKRSLIEYSRQFEDSIEALGKLKRLGELTDSSLLIKTVSEMLLEMPYSTERSKLRYKNIMAIRVLIENTGGAYNTVEIARMLGVQRNAISKRYHANKILAFKRGEHFIYPAGQFVDGGIHAGVPEVLNILGSERSDLSKVRFFLLHNSELDMNPLTALIHNHKKNIVLRDARLFENGG